MEYYKEINRREYDIISKNYINISDNQVKIIGNKYKSFKLIDDEEGTYLYQINPRLIISPCKDEWFLIESKDSYYLCDQFDGLLKFLEDFN